MRASMQDGMGDKMGLEKHSEAADRPWEPTDQELSEASRHLSQKTREREASAVDRFVVVLSQWDAYENARLRLEEEYRLIAELPGRDRNALVRQYAQARHAVEVYEKRLDELLTTMPEHERNILLSGQAFLVREPGSSIFVSVKSPLAQRLKRALSVSKPDGR